MILPALIFISYLLYSRFNIVLTDKDRVIKNTEIADSVKIVADRWIHVDLQFAKDQFILLQTVSRRNQSFLSNFKDIKIYFGGS